MIISIFIAVAPWRLPIPQIYIDNMAQGFKSKAPAGLKTRSVAAERKGKGQMKKGGKCRFCGVCVYLADAEWSFRPQYPTQAERPDRTSE
jgi:hypothetical protein